MDIRNFNKLHDNIDYLHETDGEVYRDTFTCMLDEQLIFHDKKSTLEYIKAIYRDIIVIPTPDETIKIYRSFFDHYTLEELEKIFNIYSYRLAKIVNDYIIFRPENDYQEKYTNWYFHLSPREDLCKTGIKTKNSTNIYLYPFFSLIRDDNDDVYEAIKDKAKDIADRFRQVRKSHDRYYIYAIHLPEKFPICRDHAQGRDYAVYVKNDIPRYCVELVGEA